MKKYLGELREKANITQTNAAKTFGITNRYLSMIESGKRNPSDSLKEKMANLYNVEIADIFLAIKRTKCSWKQNKKKVRKWKKVTSMPNDIMNIQEATEFLKFKSEDTLRRLCRKGEIPCRFIGGEYRFSRTALSIYIAGQDIEKYYKEAAKIMVENAANLMV